MSCCLAYMTFPCKKEAANLAKILLEKKIVSCVNVFPKVNSFFMWEGKFSQEEECVAIAKLNESKFLELEQVFLQEHSYNNPCLLKLPITGGSQNFLQWLK